MNRLIDMMTEVELSRRVLELYNGSLNNLRQDLEKLFAPIPCWSDNLDAEDNQTWVLCFVSDYSSKSTRQVGWVSRVDGLGYVVDSVSWKYATPVDFNLRYGNGEDTL